MLLAELCWLKWRIDLKEDKMRKAFAIGIIFITLFFNMSEARGANDRVICKNAQDEEWWRNIVFGSFGYIKGDEIGYDCKVGNNAEICKEMRKIFKEALYKHREELLLSGECVKVDFNKKSAE